MTNRILTAGADAFAWTPEDIVAGLDGDNSISGLGGNDTVNAGAGLNTVLAGSGDDLVTLGERTSVTLAAAQIYYGGGGRDRLYGGEAGDLLSGDKGDDELIGNGGNDTMYGGLGDDTFHAFVLGYDGPISGRDVIFGGEGNDLVDLFSGAADGLYSAEVYGGAGDDAILVDSGPSVIFGGDGSDAVFAAVLAGTGQVAQFDGGAGIDTLVLDIGAHEAATPDQVVMTRSGADFDIVVNGALRATAVGFENLVVGVAGDATLAGSSGNDRFLIGTGNTSISAGRGFDRVQVALTDASAGVAYDLDGGAGRDRLTVVGSGVVLGGIVLDMRGAEGTLKVGNGPENRIAGFELFTVSGSAVGDTIFAGDQNDTISEAPAGEASGADDLHGGAGDDRIFAGDQDDTLAGDAGLDTLIGGQGRDLILGGLGNDRILGGVEADRLYGQGGADVFVYTSAFNSGTAAGQIDNIFEFVTFASSAAEADKIDLRALGNLAFIGTDAFTAEGQVRLQQAAGGTFVVVNLVGTDGAEMKIALPDVMATDLGLQDFIL